MCSKRILFEKVELLPTVIVTFICLMYIFEEDNLESYIPVSHANYLEKSIANAVHEHLDGWIKINYEDANKLSKSTCTSISTKHLRSQENNGDESAPRILCVEAICDIVVEQLPDLWRLGQSYFTGQLHVTVDVEKQGHFKVCTLLCFKPIFLP